MKRSGKPLTYGDKKVEDVSSSLNDAGWGAAFGGAQPRDRQTAFWTFMELYGKPLWITGARVYFLLAARSRFFLTLNVTIRVIRASGIGWLRGNLTDPFAPAYFDNFFSNSFSPVGVG